MNGFFGINPNAVVIVAFCVVVGVLLGSWLVGLAVGLGVVLCATFTGT